MAAFQISSKNRNERAIIRLFLQHNFHQLGPAGGAILLGLHRKNGRFRPQQVESVKLHAR